MTRKTDNAYALILADRRRIDIESHPYVVMVFNRAGAFINGEFTQSRSMASATEKRLSRVHRNARVAIAQVGPARK